MNAELGLVQRLEAEWRRALFAKDETALRRLIHPDFQLVGVRGEAPVMLDLDGWIGALANMDVVDLEVDILDCTRTNGTIVATVDARWSVRYLGQVIQERVLLSDIWVETARGWQVLRRHSSPLACD
ncbi:nuclear transport factor 2 family protein [Sphingomicrobium astaxanthinifaciens]|uniref:nuclear transport factor 2 family protein n=1 Tax=Sphingomicrobium astaxanthinifaciens TaxID=1227949 RepID=UPI001FCB054A|nr:nuclear transport factor 2 family protein [Sphingomicrobium astaxanthinifaciens]MCJ7421585.1 nuclear transport factor 2 family protein [Sphingomicrobium astaxanthinifaciens]